jgi:hypothetical protein
MHRVTRALLGAAAAAAVLVPAPAHAQPDCRRAVVFTLPGVTWEDVDRVRPPALMQAIARGAAGSISVRTNTSRTSLASGFASIGGGARVDGLLLTGGPAEDAAVSTEAHPGAPPEVRVPVAGIEEMRALAEEAGYGAAPGALAGTLEAPLVAVGNGDLGLPPPLPAGLGRWTLPAAMDRRGVVDVAFTGSDLLVPDEEWPFGVRTDPDAIRAAVDRALAVEGCPSLIVDHGDLTRADVYAQLQFDALDLERGEALMAADGLLGHLLEELDFEEDLLVIVSPTSPAWAPVAHLGVAVAVGPGFEPGETIESASTRRRGVVTLPDVAPTVLAHIGLERPPEMNGRPILAAEAREDDRVTAAVDLDQESVFVDRMKGPISTWFVVMQVIVYALVLGLVMWRERRGGTAGTGVARGLEVAALALVAFPISTFFAGIVRAHELGGFLFVAMLLAIDFVVVGVAFAVARAPLDRLLAVSALTLIVMIADLVTGSRLQLNTVFGYSPIVAGRFAGAGNIAFAVLGAATVLTGTLIVHRDRRRRALWAVAGLFAVVVVIDGAPAFGSDVGGVIALVPSLALTWFLLSGIRPSIRLAVLVVLGMLVALTAFAALDLSRPSDQRTHLGRLVEDVSERGPEVLVDTIVRKAESNLRVFRSTVWTLFVPPALIVLGWLLTRPRGRWRRLAERYPKFRAGLLGGLLVAVLGFAVNDSGIVVPAVVLGFLVPMALMVHLKMELEDAAESAA